MEKFPELILMGQDIAEYGGVFKVTEGFVSDFGKDWVRNTPLCESAIVGIALGLSVRGMKSMVEMQFADFAACGFNQIIKQPGKNSLSMGPKCRCCNKNTNWRRCPDWTISFPEQRSLVFFIPRV